MHRLLLLLVVATSGALLGALLTRSASADNQILRARRFELVDGDGALRASMHLVMTCPTIALYDRETGRVRAAMELTLGGDPRITLMDDSAKPRLVALVDGDGSPRLEVLDAAGTTRASLGATDLVHTRTEATEKRPESSLILFRKDGKVSVSLPE